MIIQYASDLHLEFVENEFYIKNNPLKPGADILLIAGDLLQFKSMKKHDWFFDYVSDNFGVTYWIAGNHEYYNFDLANQSGMFIERIRNNIFLANDFAVTIGNVRLIFATLWTAISSRNQIAIERRMNDFHLIRNRGERLSAADLIYHHDNSVAVIEHELLATPEDVKKIVVTHHVPTFRNYPEEYKFDVLNEAFAVELKELIKRCGPDYWIYGHHHKNIPPFQICKTTLLTNQLDYVQYKEIDDFDHAKTIEL